MERDRYPVQNPWHVLVIGAGVLGSLYAAKLSQAGHAVSLLARGNRLRELQHNGLRIEERRTGACSTIRVALKDSVSIEESYDLALVVVRKTQLASVLPMLRDECSAPNVLFFVNNPEGPDRIVEAIGRERVLLGFPGAGGVLEEGAVRYALIREQPTTLGELDGERTLRLRVLATMLQGAGFRTALSGNMIAWLKTHAIFVTAVSGALYAAGASSERLARDGALLRLFVRAVREGFGALSAAGVRVTPLNLKVLFQVMPLWFAVAYWRRYFGAPMGELVFAGHARAASGEMVELVVECRALLAQCGVQAANLARLWTEVERYAGGQAAS